jgi:tetratricopeptide (TPR) repeat protein
MGYTQEGYNSLKLLHENDPRNLDVLRVLADYENSNRNIPNEINYRNQIAELDPWNAENYYNLGKLYKQQGDSFNLLKMKEKILSFALNTEIADKAKADLN